MSMYCLFFFLNNHFFDEQPLLPTTAHVAAKARMASRRNVDPETNASGSEEGEEVGEEVGEEGEGGEDGQDGQDGEEREEECGESEPDDDEDMMDKSHQVVQYSNTSKNLRQK